MAYGTIKVDTITFTDSGVDKSVSISGLVQNPTFSGNITVTGTVSGNTIQGGTLVSGATVTGGVGQFTTLTGGTAGFTTLTGTTVTGTTANFTSGNFINISGGIYTITSGVFASGTAANPSFSFVGDSNTGIYASAVDQVSITTSGTERLRVDAAGQIEAVSLGSASAPTYSFTTDPNTGIYSPGADQVAISTNGTGQLFVDASGKVTFTSDIVFGSGNKFTSSANVLSGPAGQAGAYIRSAVSSASNPSYAGADDTNTGVFIPGSDVIGFTTGGTERLRLTATGLLGLGTSSPASLLHVIGSTYLGNSLWGGSNAGDLQIAATQPYIYLRNKTVATTGTVIAKIQVDSCENSGSFDNRSGAEIRFVATSSPNTRQPTAITFATTSDAGATSLAERMRIDSGGNVGIGSTAPSQRLTIETTSSGDGIRLLNNDSTSASFSRVGFQSANTWDTNSVNAAIDAVKSGGGTATSLRFLTAGDNNTGSAGLTERARFTSDGKFLVGTSSARTNFFNTVAGTQLQVEGTTYQSSSLSLVATGNNSYDAGTLVLGKGRGNAVGSNTIVQNGTPPDILGYVSFQGNDGSEFVEGASIKAEVDGTVGANDLPSRLVFSTTADGAASPTERMRIDSSGRVGLGTSSPFTTLHSSKSVTGGSPATSGTADANVIARFQGGSVGFDLGATASGPQWIQPRNVNDLSVNYGLLLCPNGGNVGIGTTSASANLHVNGSNGTILVTGTTNASGVQLGVREDGQDVQLISNGSGGALRFYTNPSGGAAERARIDSSGRLLVGTSTSVGTISDAPKLQVFVGDQGAASFVRGSNNEFGPNIHFAKSRNTASGSRTIVQNNDELGSIFFIGDDGTDLDQTAARIYCQVDGTPGANDMPGRLVFSTTADGASSPTERMRIGSNGQTTLGNANNEYNLYVNGTATSGFTTALLQTDFSGYAPNNTAARFIKCSDTAAVRAEIRSNGGLANFSANNVNLSDRNVKKDIAAAADTWDCLKEWEIVNFRYKDQPDDADLNMGVIAQQVAESCPEVITVFQEATEDQPEKLGVKDQQMMWMAIKALQEAQARIEALEADVAQLKGA
jgi:hypothetical protein